MTDLLQAPDGPIHCSLCGAGPLDGAQPHPCPVETARRVLGGAPAGLAAALSARAYAEGGAACVEALAGCLRAMAAHVEAAGRGPGPLRVYVAGGAGEREVCGAWIRALQGAGVEVTHDWTGDAAWHGGTVAERAAADLDGVRQCDVLWLLCPVAKSEGSACELGAALAWGKRVVVSGPWDGLGRIFPGLAGEWWGTHEEGFAGVCRAAGAVGL
jgi:hypothetical protein